MKIQCAGVINCKHLPKHDDLICSCPHRWMVRDCVLSLNVCLIVISVPCTLAHNIYFLCRCCLGLVALVVLLCSGVLNLRVATPHGGSPDDKKRNRKSFFYLFFESLYSTQWSMYNLSLMILSDFSVYLSIIKLIVAASLYWGCGGVGGPETWPKPFWGSPAKNIENPWLSWLIHIVSVLTYVVWKGGLCWNVQLSLVTASNCWAVLRFFNKL